MAHGGLFCVSLRQHCLWLVRPLNLYSMLSPDQPRTYRIALLKAAHWPFVAVILGYEKWWLPLKDRTGAKSSFTAP